MSLLVVGSMAFDSIRSPFGEVERVVGGSATYFSLAASYLAPVRLVSVVRYERSYDCRREDVPLEGVLRVRPQHGPHRFDRTERLP
jgi:hypothetical protein